MPTYRLHIAYEGSDFFGYAKQPQVRTVQGDLESALFLHTGPVETVVAGRTDKGVHAREQVVSFNAEELDVERVQRSLNSMLAPNIAIRRISQVDEGFHARYSATGRAYLYQIHNSAVHDPFRTPVMWTYEPTLDAVAMDAATQCLVGVHDFAAFCRRRGDTLMVRRVEWVRWRRNADIVEMSIGAKAFCHQMVRSVVALSVEIGKGRMDVTDMQRVLESGDRAIAKGVAPPQGLTLVAVSYGAESLPRPEWIPEAS